MAVLNAAKEAVIDVNPLAGERKGAEWHFDDDHVAVQRGDAESFSSSRVVRSAPAPGADPSVASRPRFCRGASETTTRQSRLGEFAPKGAESAKIGGDFVRRMVVVFRAKTPVYWGPFSTARCPEKKLSGSLADRPGFEPAVAV